MPFTSEQFFDVFGAYNNAIWPAQIVAYALGSLAAGFGLWPSSAGDRIIADVLALMWAWTASFITGCSSPSSIQALSCSAIAYPLIGTQLGHIYPTAPTFGVTPCPMTIFTFGLILLLRTPVKWWTIAFLWSLIGGTAAFLRHVPQDWVLLATGIFAAALLWWTRPDFSS